MWRYRSSGGVAVCARAVEETRDDCVGAKGTRVDPAKARCRRPCCQSRLAGSYRQHRRARPWGWPRRPKTRRRSRRVVGDLVAVEPVDGPAPVGTGVGGFGVVAGVGGRGGSDGGESGAVGADGLVTAATRSWTNVCSRRCRWSRRRASWRRRTAGGRIGRGRRRRDQVRVARDLEAEGLHGEDRREAVQGRLLTLEMKVLLLRGRRSLRRNWAGRR